MRRDPKTGRILPRDWEEWSNENASDYRTTKHTKQCSRCSRWLTPDSFGNRDAGCNQCRSQDCLRTAQRYKQKRRELKLARERRKRRRELRQQKKEKDE